MNGNLYVFEGLDGVGKSTAAEAFADEIDAVYWESPGAGLQEIREYVDSGAHTKQTKFLMYLASNSAIADKIEPHLEAGNDVVLDRYVPTTVVYNEVGEVEKGRWQKLADQFDFVEPDQIFYLWVDEETRRQRMERREETEPSGETVEELGVSEATEAYERAAERYDMTRVEAIDGVENVVEKLLSEAEFND